MTKLTKRRGVVLALAVAGAFVLAGGVVAAQFTAPDDLAEIGAAIENEPMIRVADIPAAAGAQARGVFVQELETGHLCVWDAPSAMSRERLGGCNSADDPLGSSTLSASLSYDGGPATKDVRDARIVGLAATNVAEIRIMMTDGSVRRVGLRPTSIGGIDYGVFAYRFRPSDLRKGLGPTAVVAVNDAGQEIGRQPTGFGG